VIVKYHSPVLDSDKEARAQNIASLNSLGSFFTVTKDYSGLPTADLALRAAARELKVNSAAAGSASSSRWTGGATPSSLATC
jgi:hypothetical protein